MTTLRGFSVAESALLVLFILYLALDIPMPEEIAAVLDNPLGMILVVAAVGFVFARFHPFLGVLALFVGYEVIRRSGAKHHRAEAIQYLPSQERRDREVAEQQPQPLDTTLEEELVRTMAPIGQSSMITYEVTSYKPVAENVHGAVSVL